MASVFDLVRDELTETLRRTTGDKSVSEDTVLEDVLPAEGACETWVHAQEARYRVKLGDVALVGVFTTWTLGALAREITRLLTARRGGGAAEKTAQQDDRARAHQRYMAMRGVHMQRAKAYRLMHMHQLRRASKAYRRKVERKIVRPRKRVGSAAGGFNFIAR